MLTGNHGFRSDGSNADGSLDVLTGTQDIGTGTRTVLGQVAAEVEVDTATGEVTLMRIVSAPDCGRVLNPMTAASQVIGGVTQGIGFCLTEERVVDDSLGVVLNANPTGAKGLGELPLIPAAAAILNAIHDATGIRFRTLPVTRRRMIEALEAHADDLHGTGSDAGPALREIPTS